MATDRRRLRVLVVEDEVLLRLSVMDMLADMGHEGLEAANARQALACIAGREPIDLMLADIGLADMNGRDLAREVRKLRPGLAVIFASGRTLGDAHEPGGDARMRYLAKPYRHDDLERLLADLIPEAGAREDA